MTTTWLITPVAAACLLTGCASAQPDAPELSRASLPVARTSPGPADHSAGDHDKGVTQTLGSSAEDRLGRFRNRRAMKHVRHLAGRIGIRVRGTRGERRGISYVAGKLRALGYRVDIQKFRVEGDTSHNVVAHWPKTRSSPFVVGAHIDTVAGSPGANDNASGIAVMLENARIFAGTPQARWLEFVAFGSEEYGGNGRHHIGSTVYVNRLSNRQERRAPGMVSVDMVADGWPLIAGTAGIGPPRVARTIERILDKAGIAVDYKTTCDCSDNGPFERAGIPAAFMWSGFEPNYHDRSDRPGNLRRKHLRRSGRALRVFLKEMDFRMIRFFRNS